jgi:hypothetical protein
VAQHSRGYHKPFRQVRDQLERDKGPWTLALGPLRRAALCQATARVSLMR